LEQPQVAAEKKPYPITFDVVYPEKLSRLTTFFRIFMVIPQSIVLSVVGIVAAVVVFIAWWPSCSPASTERPFQLCDRRAALERQSRRILILPHR